MQTTNKKRNVPSQLRAKKGLIREKLILKMKKEKKRIQKS